MQVTVREATPEDYDGLCAVIDEVDALHREALPHIYRRPDGPVREVDYLLGLMADEDAGLFVAEGGDGVVGFLHVHLAETRPIPILVPRRYAVVEGLAVREGYRRSGVGRALMERAHAWARARGVKEVQLGVWEFNQDAVAFYHDLGYKTVLRRMSREV